MSEPQAEPNSSKPTRAAAVTGAVEPHVAWSKRTVKAAGKTSGPPGEPAVWSVKIQHLGQRHTFSFNAVGKEAADLEARAIYETVVAEGWEAALENEKRQSGFQKTQPHYWQNHLLQRRYIFPAAGDPDKSFAVRIGHAGSAHFFPLGTAHAPDAAAEAVRIYCTIAQAGWPAAAAQFPRELIVALEWSANPILWTYTTVHTLVGRLAAVGTSPPPAPAPHRVLIVETDPGLRRALIWCVNHQPGFAAVACETPEAFAATAAAVKPRLVLLNRSLAERMGIEFSGGLTQLKDGTLALAYAVFLDGDHMFVSTPGGAEGYLLKRTPPEKILEPLLQPVNAAADDHEKHLAPARSFFKRLLRARSGQHTDELARLTPRENEVLMLLSKGCVDKEIASAMGISVWTVHGHIKKIFERLGVRTRTEAVVRYLEK